MQGLNSGSNQYRLVLPTRNEAGNRKLVTHVDIIRINLPVLPLEFFISSPHRFDSHHRIPQVFRRKRSRFHIERLLGQLCYLRLIPTAPQNIGGGRGGMEEQVSLK